MSRQVTTLSSRDHDQASGQVNIRLRGGLHERLEAYCKRYNVTKASVLREGLVKELDKRERP